MELIRHRCNTMVCRVAPKGGDAKGGRKASEEKSGHSTAKATKQPCSKSATVGCKMCEKQVGCSHCKPICIASSRFSADLRGRVDLPGATPLFDVGRTTQVQPENLVDVYCGCPRDNLCAARPCYANPATAAHPRPARRAARANPILVIVRTPMPRLQVQASRAVLHALPRAGREWRVAGAAGDVRPLLPGLPFPHLQRDWAHPCHICARSGLARDTSAPDGLTPPRSAPELCSWLATSAA